jgi:DNA-directed RNA polymerase specialized sigma24 family protein
MSGTTTLGDLLYSDSLKVRIPESDWVALVVAIAEGRMAGMQALYERSGSLVFWLALRITGDPTAAEAVLLNVFQDIWTRARDYDASSGSVLGWVMILTRSHSLEMVSSSDLTKSEVLQPPYWGLSNIEARIRSGLSKLRFALTGEGTP